MRSVQAAMAVLLCAGGLCAAGANPTTQPALESRAVLVVRFDAPPNHQQLATDVPQNLRVALNGYVRGHVTAPADEPPAQDAAAAVRAARRYKAAVVIFGSVQVSEQAVRVSGQAIDAGSGKVLTGLRATGELSQVFQVEDDLAKQIVRALPAKWLTPKSLAVLWNDQPPPMTDAAPRCFLPSTRLGCELPPHCFGGSVYASGGLAPVYPGPGPLFGPSYGGVGPAYPDFIYHPYANNNPELFVFVTVHHRH